MSGAHDRSMEDWTGEIGDRWLAWIDTFESMIAPAGAAALDAADFRPGQTVVDIGCGGGATTLEIARRVGPQGRALGVDVAPQLIERAQQRRTEAGVANAAFETGDAQTHRPADAPFDRAFSRFGVMFFDDTQAAFANIHAWLKPGGEILFACWDSPERNPWMGMTMGVIGAYVTLPERDPAAPGPFRLADPEATRAMLGRAGYRDIDIRSWQGEQHLGGAGADPEAAARFAMQGMGMAALFEEQAPDRLPEAQARLAETLRPHYRDGAVRVPAAIWLVRART